MDQAREWNSINARNECVIAAELELMSIGKLSLLLLELIFNVLKSFVEINGQAPNFMHVHCDCLIIAAYVTLAILAMAMRAKSALSNNLEYYYACAIAIYGNACDF